ncbi:cysteine S-palmitoyltransferase protein [Trichomonas vaginalis G3]|uniref:cysteine S-palmitoyltransferase protein n=1 Tax=Trichomonas vaginalis (strain ATCC PRA-98 / G3) TaxID=412133 RepID=UPI0021E52E7D|nr:cysteine S-palmitoyltransferase protein [Trichomonas vaginalis G3]KAI5539943.1 cysteine S-palmitoyltransferase protein [Trichomonas vaginalis G3]
MKDDQPFDEWLRYSLLPNFAFYGAIISLIQPVLLLPLHTFLILSNKTTWEILKGKEITYLTNWKLRLSPFSHGMIQNIREFCFMRWEVPVYKVPFTPEEMEQYKADNSCIMNDTCNCC